MIIIMYNELRLYLKVLQLMLLKVLGQHGISFFVTVQTGKAKKME